MKAKTIQKWLLLIGAAFIALYRFKLDVLWVVLAGGVMGLARIVLFA